MTLRRNGACGWSSPPGQHRRAWRRRRAKGSARSPARLPSSTGARCANLAADLEVQRRTIADQAASIDPAEALELMWRFMGLAEAAAHQRVARTRDFVRAASQAHVFPE